MTHRQAGRAAFAAVVVVSLVVLFTPASGVPSGIPVSDKVIHAWLFAALAVTGRLAGLPWLVLLLGLVAYAGISEILQTVLPISRDGDVRDALADSLGVLVGLGLVVLVERRNRRVEA
ncbi:MAG: rane protein [Marmoricola sp.]|nr:rane protein [Marmoricola sp.]